MWTGTQYKLIGWFGKDDFLSTYLSSVQEGALFRILILNGDFGACEYVALKKLYQPRQFGTFPARENLHHRRPQHQRHECKYGSVR